MHQRTDRFYTSFPIQFSYRKWYEKGGAIMYIDLFIIQNLIYDYLILTGVAILTDEEFQYSRLLVGLSVGLLLSTFLFTIDITFLIGLVPFVMIWIVFKKQPVKKYGTKVLYFYCLSMILSGSIYSIAHFIKFEMTIIPYIISLFIISVFITICYILKVRWIGEQQTIQQFTYSVKIFCGEKEIKGTGFVDTGNHLLDEKTRQAIMIMPKIKLSGNSILEFLNERNISCWYTHYSVINEEDQLLLVFRPTLLLIDNQVVHNVLIGVIDNTFIDYDFLLQPKMVQNI